MKQFKKAAAFLCAGVLALGSVPAMAETTFEGSVVSGRSVSITAPFGGTVSAFSLREGSRIGVGDAIADIETTKVYASADGVVAGVFGQEGDSVEDVTARYGTVLYIAPESKYTSAGDIEKAYNSSETRYVNISEAVYMVCTTDGKHTATGVITAVSGTGYTVETTSGELLMKAGNLFSFLTYYKPNTTVEKLAQTGYETLVIPISKEGIKSNASISSLVYSLANAAQDKVKAAQFMNFAYTNGDFNDLINWGVEGEDWIEDENGQAAYPAGIDANNVATHNDYGWGLPNQFVAHAWAGNPIDIWDQYRDYNEAMKKSIAYGFSFDSTVVTDQVAQCTSVESEFNKSIIFGAVSDIDQSIADFHEKLYAAGLQDIIDAKQEQLDAWLANNK